MARALIDLAPLRASPQFRRLWIGRSCSGLGMMMTLVAVMYQVWQQTGSTAWTGGVGLAQALPVVGFGLFAGSLADRGDRRRIYLIATIGQAVCSAALAVQGFAGWLPPAGVLALVAAQSAASAAAGPPSRAFLRRLLAPDQVAAGLALNMIGFQAALLLGPALAGLVLGWLGVGTCYLVDAITYLAAFSGAFGLPPMPPDGEPASPGLAGVREGLGFLLRSPRVRGALLTDLAATVLSFPVSLFPLINAERFGGNPRTLGLFMTAMAVGGVTASALSGTFTRLSRPGLVMIVSAAAWGAALALFGVAPGPWLGFACLLVAGAADSISVVSRGTVIQLHTPDALLGRVVAAEQIVGQAGPNLGNLRGGLVASATSGLTALVSGGLLCVATVAAVAATTPELRRPGVLADEGPGGDPPAGGGQPDGDQHARPAPARPPARSA
ncbi:MAG TPA: MFS transporter [Streptosporangiaceae bacterium]|nr:MFS transporter [Streptosporangiaceae bacterium]